MRAKGYGKELTIKWMASVMCVTAVLLTGHAMDDRTRAILCLTTNDPLYIDMEEPTNLPASVPPAYDLDGTYFHWGLLFTTKAYQEEAFKLVLAEANKAAKELHLPERLPITVTNLTESHISRYGHSRIGTKPIGNVTTKDYCYSVSLDHKLSYVEKTHQDQDALKWRKEFKWPLSKVDTNTPYQLATQWLAAVSMDIKGLNRDCEVHVVPERYWNNPKFGGKTFVPLYEVYWLSPLNKKKGYGDIAQVILFLPTKTLVSLRVEDPKYILRPPIIFTNLAKLLSDTNRSIPLHFPPPRSPSNLLTNENPNSLLSITPVNLAHQISNADRIICTNFLHSEGEPKN